MTNEEANKLRNQGIEHSLRGDTLFSNGDHEGALEAYRASLAVDEKLCEAFSKIDMLQNDRLNSLGKVGKALRATGRADESIRTYEAALKIAERLAEKDPQSNDAQRDLAIAHNGLGHGYRDQDDARHALLSYRAGLSLTESLVKKDPSNEKFERDLLVSYLFASEAMVMRGHELSREWGGWDEATKAFRTAVSIREKLAKKDADNPHSIIALYAGQMALAGALNSTADPEGALKIYQTAREVRLRAAQLESSSPEQHADALNEVDKAIQSAKDLIEMKNSGASRRMMDRVKKEMRLDSRDSSEDSS